MKVAAMVLLLASLQVGCGRSGPVPSPNSVSFRNLVDGPGGPRVITEFKGSKINEILEAKYKDLTPGYVQSFGERVEENGKQWRGVRVVLVGTSAGASTRDKLDIRNFYLSEAEARECARAVGQALQFKPAYAGSQQYMQWVGPEALTLVAGKADGQATYYLSLQDKAPIITLNAEQLGSFSAGVLAGLDVAK